MQLLDGLHATKVIWFRRERRYGLMVVAGEAPMLDCKPGSDADEMWLALTKFANSQRESEQPVREKEIA